MIWTKSDACRLFSYFMEGNPYSEQSFCLDLLCVICVSCTDSFNFGKRDIIEHPKEALQHFSQMNRGYKTALHLCMSVELQCLLTDAREKKQMGPVGCLCCTPNFFLEWSSANLCAGEALPPPELSPSIGSYRKWPFQAGQQLDW